jgi:hypothetical protein
LYGIFHKNSCILYIHQVGRELLERAIALSFLRRELEDDEEDTDEIELDDDDLETQKRFLFGKDKNKGKPGPVANPGTFRFY